MAPRKLSMDPAQVRVRLRRRSVDAERDVAMLYGKPVEEWDLEELARGRPRNKAGKFSGPRPPWLTPLVLAESRRRLHEETYGQLAGYAQIALKVMKNLMESTEVDANGRPLVDAKTKLAAASFVLEHIIGKPKAVVEINDPSEFQRKALAAAIVLDDGKPQGHLTILEGEFEEVEEAGV